MSVSNENGAWLSGLCTASLIYNVVQKSPGWLIALTAVGALPYIIFRLMRLAQKDN